MSLLTTWTAANRVVSEALSTVYSTDIVGGSANQPEYMLTRHRTKKYEYVGLTESAAVLCAAAMCNQYTRTFKDWSLTNGTPKFWKLNGNTYQATVATIAATRDQGPMWRVEITVDETVKWYMNTTPPASYETFFNAKYPGWTYDE